MLALVLCDDALSSWTQEKLLQQLALLALLQKPLEDEMEAEEDLESQECQMEELEDLEEQEPQLESQRELEWQRAELELQLHSILKKIDT